MSQTGAPPGTWQRRVLIAGLSVVAVAFVGTTAWLRTAAPARPGRAEHAATGPASLETELDRLIARATERIDAHDEGGAEEAAMRAAAVDPSDPRAQLLLGRIHLRLGQRERARSELERVLSLEPSGPRADEARALLSSFR